MAIHEIRRQGMRYTGPNAERSSQPSAEEGNDPVVVARVSELKQMACDAANAIVPGIVGMPIAEARKAFDEKFDVGEMEREFLRRINMQVFNNYALFVHYLSNVLGFTYQEEKQVIDMWSWKLANKA